MQPRLTRSSTDKMIGGVSGGLGEYFNLDPVIVRLIFVLVTLTSGLGVPIYVVLWMIMPQQAAGQAPPAAGQEGAQLGQQLGQEARWGGDAREVMVAQQRQAQGQARVGGLPPAPAEYRFDPFTGQPVTPEPPAVGQTVSLGAPPLEPPAPYVGPPPRRRNWNVLGSVLIGIGGLILLEQIGINMSFVFPLLLIVAGVILLRRRR